MTEHNLEINPGYIEEKAMNSLGEIVEIVETLKREQDSIPIHVAKRIRADLINTLHNLTKVLAAAACSLQKHDWSDADLIFDKGRIGLEDVFYKYGCISETTQMRKDRERLQFASSVLGLSKDDRAEGRTAIHEECIRFGGEPLANEVVNLLEPVTQGTKTWSEFQQEIQRLLSPYA